MGWSRLLGIPSCSTAAGFVVVAQAEWILGAAVALVGAVVVVDLNGVLRGALGLNHVECRAG